MSPFTPLRAIYALWLLFVVSWAVAAVGASGAAARPGLGVQLRYFALNWVGVMLLVFVTPSPVLRFVRVRRLISAMPGATPLWATPPLVGWILFGLSVVGFAFAWWARLHLGALWSATITRKADQTIVETGPYALVHHPIYTGLILAVFALAALKASPVAVLGAVLVSVGWWVKAGTEETFLREGLSPEARAAYDAYRARVPMLVPGFGRR